MAFYDKFPYTNFQELNLDWLTQEVSKVRDNRDASDASAAAALASEKAAKASETAAATSQQAAAASQQAAAGSEEASADYLAQIGTHTAGAVADWLQENIQPTTPAVDASLSVSGAAADAKKTGDAVSNLKSALEDMASVTHTDLLYGFPRTENWFVDNATGEGRTLVSFCSFLDVPIPDGTESLWPYNDFSDDKYIRSVCFYNSEKGFISGVSGNIDFVNNGIRVPNGAKFVSASLTYANSGTQTLGEHYLSTEKGGDHVTKEINSDYKISPESIDGVFSQNNNNVRMPCINFQFDDGAANDANIVSIFKSHGLTCGFALISNITSADVARYLGYQSDGFEMLCHADNGTGMSDATVSPEVIETRLKTSKDILEGYGFDIKGFVTPSSTMADAFKPILRKYYQWAETVYFGSYTGTGQPYMKPVDGIYNGWRVSLQNTTLANQKAAVDACIANYGVLTFYGHSAEMDGSDNLTTANLTELLTYITAKVQNGYCKVGNPSDIIQNYFNVRNDDISSDWISVPYTDASLELDSRLEVLNWDMRYSPKLKLFSFGARLRATEAISGTFIICKMPVRTYFNGIQLINESSGKIMIYDGEITSFLSSWGSGKDYRMNVVCACH